MSEMGEDTVDLGVDGLSPAVYVGAGGSANVFAARLIESGEQVAVKLLRASADSAKERERFVQERETLDLLSSHEGIVHVVDAGVTDRNEPYFLMPLMEGSLQDRIDSEGALHWETASQLVAEVADTIEFAHNKKILHRDLKPGNILLDTVGVPRVSDFGIAKLMDSSVSKSSKALGTPSFMPPERFRAVEATEASDVYGLGATLAALLTGTAPFLTGENDTDAAVMMRVMSEEPAPLTLVGIPEPIANVVTQSMMKDPIDRPESAAEFAHLLRTATIDAGGAAASGPVTVAIPRRDLTIPEFTAVLDDDEQSQRKPVLMMAVAAAIFALVIGLGASLALTRDGATELASGDAGDVTAEVASATEENSATEGSSATEESSAEGGADADGDEKDGSEGSDEAGKRANSAGASEQSSANGQAVSGTESSTHNTSTGAASSTGTATSTGTTGGATTSGTTTHTETTETNVQTGTTNNTSTNNNTSNTGGTSTGGSNTGGGATGPTTTPTTEAPPVTEAPTPRPDACFSTSKSSVETGDAVSFTNCSADAASYRWDFGDGTTSSQRSPSKSWTTTGTKRVQMTATGDGGTDTHTVQITVTEQPPAPVVPTACFSSNKTTVETGESVSFSNCSQDATSYSWDFGGSTSSQRSPSTSWSTPGSKRVVLTATGAGGTDTETKWITVNAPAVPPTACFSASNTNPVVNNDSVSFSNCSEDATSYSWNFGDGSSSSSASPSHTYNQVGTFTVTLTATGDGTDSTTRTITVKNQDRLVNDPPQAENISCQNISATEERWTWDVYGRVDDYVMVRSNGSTQSMGRSSGFVTGNNTLTAIISERDGLETKRSIGAPSSYGCTGWVTPTVPTPAGVSCSFSNFQPNDANTNWKSWTSHWKWSVHPDVDSYIVEFDTTGRRINLGKAGAYDATNVKGFRDGSQIQKIIAVKAGVESQPRTLTSCGSEGGGPTWKNFGS